LDHKIWISSTRGKTGVTFSSCFLKLFWFEAVSWKQMVGPVESPRHDNYRSSLSLSFCIKNVTFLQTSSKPILFVSVGCRVSLGSVWGVALPCKKSSFCFSMGRILGVMLFQRHIHENFRDSYKPFICGAKLEGPVELNKILLEKLRANLNYSNFIRCP
jgi:hypothetical protein